MEEMMSKKAVRHIKYSIMEEVNPYSSVLT